MKTQLEEKCRENKKLIEDVMKVKEKMERRRFSHPTRQLAASLDHRHNTYSGEA